MSSSWQPTFTPTYIIYVPPEVPISLQLNANQRAGKQIYQSKVVDMSVFYNSLKDFFTRYMNEVDSGRSLNPDDFKWNLFTVIGIPEGSLIGKAGPSADYRGHRSFAEYFRAPFFILHMDTRLQRFFTDQTNGGILTFRDGYDHQLQWTYSYSSGPVFFPPKHLYETSYKIHITPKHEYAMYTQLRLFSIMKANSIFHNKQIKGKIMLAPRDNKPTEENTFLTQANGGGSPTIVIYCTTDKETVKQMIDVLLHEFQSEVSILGNMTSDYKYRVLPFNVRLNSLIQYAQGDRVFKINDRDRFILRLTNATINRRNIVAAKKYVKAKWVTDLAAQCSSTNTNTKTLAEQRAMQFLGKHLCTDETQSLLADLYSLDDIHWMTGDPEGMLSPLELTNVVLESESATTIVEADTTANNLVVHADPAEAIGAGAGNPPSSGGKRTRRKRKQRKSRKQRK